MHTHVRLKLFETEGVTVAWKVHPCSFQSLETAAVFFFQHRLALPVLDIHVNRAIQYVFLFLFLAGEGGVVSFAKHVYFEIHPCFLVYW